jgi:hypothetical protein
MKSFLLLPLLSIPFMLFAHRGQSAAVRQIDGKPVLFVNDRPELPFMYALTHASGGRWSWEEMPAHNLRLFSQTGVKLYQVDLSFEDLWQEGSRHLQLDLAKRQVKGVLDACPTASVVIRLHVNAPMWWNRAHPEECVQFADGPIDNRPFGLPFNYEDGDIYRDRRASLASSRWKQEAGRRVAEFCRRFAGTREGKSVIGIHLSGGVYGEWHPWGFIRNEPDVSQPMQDAFRAWLRVKYGNDAALQAAWGDPGTTLATATVPDTAQRRCCFDGYFRKPAAGRQTLDFYKCQQEVVADDIEFFCRTVKQNWNRPLLTGAFYGYIHFGLCRQALNGHLEIGRLLDSPWIDYFAGPPSYYKPSRALGGSGQERAPVHSMLLHGKLWFDEVDNGSLQDKKEQDFVRSLMLGDTAYIHVLHRSLWLPMQQGCGLWLYDFGPRRNTGWWDSPLYQDEIRNTLKHFQESYGKRLDKPHRPPADILAVWDPASYYGVENVFSKTCEQGMDAAAEDLVRAGAIDQIYLSDLHKVDLNAYKAVIFMNAWSLDQKQRRFILDSVASNQRTIVWNFMAGYSDGTRLGSDLVEQITGLSLHTFKAPDKIAWDMGDLHFKNPEKIQPFLTIEDHAAEPLASLQEMPAVVMARKKFPAYTAVYAAVPLHGTAVFKKIFEAAGCRPAQ